MAMESAEELQGRIASFHELQSIVRTMKALSAVSIHQYEKSANSLADYFRTVELGLHVVLRYLSRPMEPRARQRGNGRLAAVVFGSDHGLCGRFNEEVAEHATERMDAVDAPAERLVLAVGARVAAQLEQAGEMVEEDFLVPGSAARITATVQQILVKIDDWQQNAGVDSIYIFYNQHLSGARYRPTGFQLLPVDLRRFRHLEERPWPSRALPTYTMGTPQLLTALLRQYFFVSIFRACAESQASEHGARLAAMQNAEKNLQERLEEITTQFRRVRQEAITSELLDVVSGFEASAREDP